MRILRKGKMIFAAIGIVILCISPAMDAYAATPTLGRRYINGVGNVTVWLNYGSGVGYWSSYITNAANNWMYPGSGMGNPIYMKVVSSNYGSTMDFHQKSQPFWGGASVIAETRFFVNGGSRVDPRYSNWNYTEIYINNDAYRSSSITNDMALGTTIHEMGHAFGLDHTTNIYSIMAQTGAGPTKGGRIVQRVQRTDNDAINILY